MISEIIDGTLWIGNFEDAIQKQELFDYIISVAVNIISPIADVIFNLYDDEHPKNISRFYLCCELVDKLLKAGKKVLVHCYMGHNRSVAVGFNLFRKYNPQLRHFDKALKEFKMRHPETYLHDFWIDVLTGKRGP